MRTFLALALMGSVAACATEGAAPVPAPVQATQPIINGTADTTFPAAVFVYNGTGGCTGTLFKVDRANDLAWVLTAAHCVLNEDQTALAPAELIIIGNDYEQDPNAVPVKAIRSKFDTRYQSSDEYDFAVVTLQGLPGDDVLPAPIPLTAASDGLAEGQTVTSYGFGTTGFSGGQPVANSVRHRLTKQIADLNSADITYSQPSSGICYGDSGGPVISAAGKVVGVHSRVGSAGSNPCNGEGISARLSNGLSFVNGVVAADLADLPTPIPACDRCVQNSEYGDSVCRTKRGNCTTDADCNALLDCLTTNNGGQKCYTDHPDSVGLLYEYASCACNDVCTSECSGNSTCQGWADVKCGAHQVAASQRACARERCCAELDAASANKAAYKCLQEDDGTACEGNAAYEAAAACMQDNCASGSSSGTGGSSGSGGDDDSGDDDATGDDDDTAGTKKKKTTTTTTSGCAVDAPASGAAVPNAAVVLVGLGLIAALRRKRAVA